MASVSGAATHIRRMLSGYYQWDIMQDDSRRRFLVQTLTALAGVTVSASFASAQAKPPLVVYKDPNCGCCQFWIEYMQKLGYKATVNSLDQTAMQAIKSKHKIAPTLQSCHTTLVGGYVIEGHVPVEDIVRLLKEKPAGVVGLTIPGMPASAPGMDQVPFRPYTVLSFDAKGATKPFAVHSK